MAEYSGIVTLKKVATAITGVDSIGGLPLKTERIDVTSLADTWRRRISGLLDGGELSFTLIWDPDNATHAALMTDFLAKTPAVYNLLLAGAATKTFSFTATPSAIQVKAGVGNRLEADCVLSVDGEVTYT